MIKIDFEKRKGLIPVIIQPKPSIFTVDGWRLSKKISSFHPPVNFAKPHRAERMEHSVKIFCQALQLEDLSELI